MPPSARPRWVKHNEFSVEGGKMVSGSHLGTNNVSLDTWLEREAIAWFC